MSDVIENLRSFNRKERFFFVGWAIGNAEFALSSRFRSALETEAGVVVAPTYFTAMDYHLDWIYASVCRSGRREIGQIHKRDEGLLKATNEDVDLLIAFDQGDTCHLVFVEAKWAGAWDNSQLASKLVRLDGIVKRAEQEGVSIQPHFVLASRTPPQKVRLTAWPTWAKKLDGRPNWIQISGDPGSAVAPALRLTRCDNDGVSTSDESRAVCWRVIAG